MANIRLVAKCGSVVEDTVTNTIGEASFAFKLVDESLKEIPARFSLTSSESELPMAAITEYGMLIGLFTHSDVTKLLTITATPLDGSSAVSVTKGLGALIEMTVPSNVTA